MYKETVSYETFNVGSSRYLATVVVEQEGDYYYKFVSEIRREEVFADGEHGVNFMTYEGIEYGFYLYDSNSIQTCNIPYKGSAAESLFLHIEEQDRIDDFYQNRKARPVEHEVFNIGSSRYLATIEGDYKYRFISAIRRKEVFAGGKHGVGFVTHKGVEYGFYTDGYCQQDCNIPYKGDAAESLFLHIEE